MRQRGRCYAQLHWQIFSAMGVGAAVGTIGGEAVVPRVSWHAGFQAMMRLTGWIIRLAPLGVFGLIASMVGSAGFSTFRSLGLYMVTIALGLALQLFVTLPLLLILLERIDPRVHFRNLLEPLAVAFSTASSGATLPVTLRAVEHEVGERFLRRGDHRSQRGRDDGRRRDATGTAVRPLSTTSVSR